MVGLVFITLSTFLQYLTFGGKQACILVKHEMVVKILSFHLIFLPIIAKSRKTKTLGTHTSLFRSECGETASLGLSFSTAQPKEKRRKIETSSLINSMLRT